MIFHILLEESAYADLQRLPKNEQLRIIKKTEKILSVDPFPQGKNPKKLKGGNAFRLRSGNFRVLYKVVGKNVLIFGIGFRKDIYKKYKI